MSQYNQGGPGGFPPQGYGGASGGGQPPGYGGPPGAQPPGYGGPPGGQPPGFGGPPGGQPPGFGGPPGGQPPGFGGPPGGQPPGYGAPGASAPTPGAIAPTGGMSPGFAPPEDVEAGKLWALLGYVITPLWIVPLIQRDNAFALFHAKQMLAFSIACVVATIPISIVGTITCGIGFVLYLPLIYPWFMGILYSVQGQYRAMPWFGFIAEKYLEGIQADKRPGGAPR
ncbi:MAG: hypothetical protein JW751_09630 [Polyangiaceae bacterium]|nr:hypothetical protein [Polyangiaceae bacterium]